MSANLELNQKLIQRVLDAVAERLSGDWLLVGGALVATWLEPTRVTEDIDIMSVQGAPTDRVRLMDLAHDLGLSIESVNSAADYFVRRLPGWEHQIEEMQRGKAGRILRPNPTLFLLLKIGRLSEIDLKDCLTLLERAGLEGWAIDAQRVLGALKSMPPAQDTALEGRRHEVEGALQRFAGKPGPTSTA